ncbi:MAG TPA: GntR family transcriptional regulator [Anaerolineaceae bacterium]
MAQRNLDLKLDFRSGLPIYAQIVEQIRHMLAAGELNPGDQLPTVRQLATDLRVNFNTIARAYRLLDEAGLISTQQGRGTYIWETPTPETTQKLRRQELEELTRHYLSEAAALGFSIEEVQRDFEEVAGMKRDADT